jgi:taurine dioxygenase
MPIRPGPAKAPIAIQLRFRSYEGVTPGRAPSFPTVQSRREDATLSLMERNASQSRPARRRPGPVTLRRLPEGWRPHAFERIRIRPAAATLGAYVEGVDLSEPMDAQLFEELDRALLEWKVLFFRNQPLSVEAHGAFAARWGPLFDDHLIIKRHENPAEAVVVYERNEEIVGLENEWHCDGSFRLEVPMGTVLRAIEVPDLAGDTLFADMAAAWDDLPEALRETVQDLRAVHDWSLGAYAEKYGEQLAELRAAVPPVEQPVVRRHPVTGRNTLFVNRLFTREIVGVTPQQSEALLERLCAQAELPELQCRLRWEPGTIAFWDNNAVQHYGANDYWPQRRVMARASIERREIHA